MDAVIAIDTAPMKSVISTIDVMITNEMKKNAAKPRCSSAARHSRMALRSYIAWSELTSATISETHPALIELLAVV